MAATEHSGKIVIFPCHFLFLIDLSCISLTVSRKLRSVTLPYRLKELGAQPCCLNRELGLLLVDLQQGNLGTDLHAA